MAFALVFVTQINSPISVGGSFTPVPAAALLTLLYTYVTAVALPADVPAAVTALVPSPQMETVDSELIPLPRTRDGIATN